MSNLSGGKAISQRLSELAEGGSVKGFYAKVSALTKSEAGQRAMMDAGIDLGKKSTRRTVLGWLSDPDAAASAKYRRAVDDAYSARKRQTMASSLKRRLSNDGRGTRVEVYPPDQAQVAAKRKRDLEVRRINVRPSQWDSLIGAWARGDEQGMQDAWIDLAADAIGTDYGAYAVVGHIGFGA